MTMRKTLLLAFIHGFKGGDDTFGKFPEHLRALVSHALPNIDIVALQYPKYETRGDLSECVERFREWLQNKVIDIEVAHSTPSPTVDPSVHVILIGHSMGGIVAAETLLLVSGEQPIPAASSTQNPSTPNFPSNTTLNSTSGSSHPNLPRPDATHSPHKFLFPHIQGILAFDTPYLGLAPQMVAHGIEGGHKMASTAYASLSEAASVLGWGTKSEPNLATAPAKTPAGALPVPPALDDAAAAPTWQTWGKYAMFAGAAGALAAGGAAALYSQREKITAGWAWASSHLLFVSDLAKGEKLRTRVERVDAVCKERGLGFANLYTNLGKGAREGYGITASLAGADRTFCNLPVVVRDGKEIVKAEAVDVKTGTGLKWMKTINDKAKDETSAHMHMFYPRENPGFYALGEQAKGWITAWIDQDWYGTSEVGKPAGYSVGLVGEDWEKMNKEEVDKHAGQEKTREGEEWVEGTKDWRIEDVEMRDEIHEDDDGNKENINEDMETSVIVDKTAEAVPLSEAEHELET